MTDKCVVYVHTTNPEGAEPGHRYVPLDVSGRELREKRLDAIVDAWRKYDLWLVMDEVAIRELASVALNVATLTAG